MSIHYPFIEAGHVRSLCGEPHSKNAWTTKTGAVTCPRCHRLLEMEEQVQSASSARPTSASSAAHVPEPRL